MPRYDDDFPCMVSRRVPIVSVSPRVVREAFGKPRLVAVCLLYSDFIGHKQDSEDSLPAVSHVETLKKYSRAQRLDCACHENPRVRLAPHLLQNCCQDINQEPI
jgi:hypothetical protein